MVEEDNSLLPLKVGGLLYTPAINVGIAEKLIGGSYPCLTSAAFCLEDAIRDEALSDAERELKATLYTIGNSGKDNLPLIFVRIRTPRHMLHIHELLGKEEALLTGYILPKFDLSNAGDYAELITRFNSENKKRLYIMPILESRMIADIAGRTGVLTELKAALDKIRPMVLGVRVGGNDFSNLYGLRRSVSQTIYDIGVIRDILTDIINVFAAEYIVSGAVWEYFGTNGGEWERGLRRELELDRLNGFIGKTAVHPSQLPIIYDSLKVSRFDYEDAKKILSWSEDKRGVAKSADGSRMNEVKCHGKWAEKILKLAQVYGIRDDT